ncbi:MAG TPA: sigma-70 family RNA polymerase sigma factor [Pseudonocardiaceae bacterium]
MTVTGGAHDSLAGADVAGPDVLALRAAHDIELLRLVRAGYDDAFAELFARHASAVRGFAMRCCTDVADAEDLAAEAFFRVLQAVRRGSGPDDNVRAYLLTVVRRLAAEWSVRRRDVPVTDEELSRQVDAGYVASASRVDLQLIARAFATLPQRWRAVLWRVEVEGERPAMVARYFGLSANATAALARRARQGLRAAYLQAHLAPSGGATGCRAIVDKLGGFTAGQVTGAEAGRIRAHLATCSSCASLQAELADVCAGLRRYAGSLTAPAAGLALGAHHHVLGATVVKLKLAAMGARAKLVVAAASMAAAGGLGVVSGPVLAHLNPVTINADRGDPPLLHAVSGTSAPANVPATHSSGSPFDPTMRSVVHGPQPRLAAGSPGTTTVVPSLTTTTNAVGAGPAGATSASGGSTKSVQAQQAGVTSTQPTNSVALATTPPPTKGSGTSAPQKPHQTVWSTSWTANGTTVYETVWSWSDTVN